MQTHPRTSQQPELHLIAQLRPLPVELPVTECQGCDGRGWSDIIIGGWSTPRTRREPCEDCGGEGVIHEHCLVCGEAATTRLPDCELCDDCLMTHVRPDDGIDYVVAFALKVMP